MKVFADYALSAAAYSVAAADAEGKGAPAR